MNHVNLPGCNNPPQVCLIWKGVGPVLVALGITFLHAISFIKQIATAGVLVAAGEAYSGTVWNELEWEHQEVGPYLGDFRA